MHERTRLAREIHDILAHSLGALSTQLEAAQALLRQSPATREDPALGKALDRVGRACRRSRPRGPDRDPPRRPRPARGQRAPARGTGPPDHRSRAGRHRPGREPPRRGTVRHLEPDATLAVLRTAQEAVTNAAKHAPGQPVTLTLVYSEDHTTLTASNPLPDAATPRPLGASGGGYGLTGLRERALLADGTLHTEVMDNAWQACVTIPA
ncbi:sensor histidine kinase [Streptomyces sp. CG1]|uniref:sensor histidine kinase n=1 Tax=Streptomyces sp. CG1 TaxID=1287523 RepID=UPI0034E2A56F